MFSLQQIDGEPTRITSTSKSLIDQILCNNQDNIVQRNNINWSKWSFFNILYTESHQGCI